MTNRACGACRVLLLLALLPCGLSGQSLPAQPATVRVKDNLRAAPNGEVVAVLEPGTVLSVAGRRDRWLDVVVEGWVWTASLQTTNREGYDLVVSAAAGENLRVQPSGAIVGRLGRGTLLDEQERSSGWVRARRRGWFWAESAALSGATTTASSQPRAASPSPSPQAPPTPRPAPAVRGPATSAAGAAILASPDGDTLARIHPGAQLQVVDRQGSWARVRVDGWTWLPTPDGASDVTPAKLDAATLTADPESFRGRVVSWDLQFLSVERAERIRTDFFEGEPFLLTRHSGGGYVYVALAPERLAEARSLLPLERITVIGRVRAPASALTGSPILDLIEITRVGGR